MAAINFGAFRNVFIKTEEKREELGRDIHRFSLIPRMEAARAAAAIQSFLANNPEMVLVSRPREGETLGAKAIRCPYLIVNGGALCLSNKPKGPDIDLTVKDMLFSEALIEEPIKCSRGHVFEREHIAGWVESKGDFCPYQEDHVVGSLIPDSIEVMRVRSAIERHQRQAGMNQEMEERLQQAQNQLAIQNMQINLAEARLGIDRTSDIVGGLIKLTLQGGVLIGAKIAEGPALNAVAKHVPIISIAFACVLAANRFVKGYQGGDQMQYAKGVLEIFAGALASFPVYGTTLALQINILMAAHDFSEVLDTIEVNPNPNTRNAHRILGLNPDHVANKQEIDEAFRKLSYLTHPDRMSGFGDYTRGEIEELQKMLGAAKCVLYVHYGFDAGEETSPPSKRRRMAHA